MLEACEGVKLLKVYDVLPSNLVYNHGIVIFKEIDNEYCVAVLNPLNTGLMKNTLNLLDKKVTFFLASASDFDLFLKKHAQSH